MSFTESPSYIVKKADGGYHQNIIKCTIRKGQTFGCPFFDINYLFFGDPRHIVGRLHAYADTQRKRETPCSYANFHTIKSFGNQALHGLQL